MNQKSYATMILIQSEPVTTIGIQIVIRNGSGIVVILVGNRLFLLHLLLLLLSSSNKVEALITMINNNVKWEWTSFEPQSAYDCISQVKARPYRANMFPFGVCHTLES